MIFFFFLFLIKSSYKLCTSFLVFKTGCKWISVSHYFLTCVIILYVLQRQKYRSVREDYGGRSLSLATPVVNSPQEEKNLYYQSRTFRSVQFSSHFCYQSLQENASSRCIFKYCSCLTNIRVARILCPSRLFKLNASKFSEPLCLFCSEGVLLSWYFNSWMFLLSHRHGSRAFLSPGWLC